jgi:hypothetical protein
MLGLEQNICGQWSARNSTGNKRKDNVLIVSDRLRQTVGWTNFTIGEVVKRKLDENDFTLHN